MQADTKNGESTFDGTKESAHLMKPRKAFDQLKGAGQYFTPRQLIEAIVDAPARLATTPFAIRFCWPEEEH